MNTAHELKRLKREIAEAQEDLRVAGAERGRADTRVFEASARVRDLEDRRRELLAAPVVTEHALLRYCERVLGVNLEEITAAVLSEKNRGIIETIGSGKLPLGNGHVAVVQKKTVVTIE